MAYRIGLDLNLFWRLNPRRMEPFLDMFEKRQDEQRKYLNFQAYLTGLYVRHAIVSSLDSGVRYPDEPYDVRSQKEIDQFVQSQQYVEQQRLIMLAKMRQDERRKRKEARQTLIRQPEYKE